MAGAVRPSLFLAILVQLGPCFLWAAPAGNHSLCYDFTINSKPAPGQQWCTVQAQVDQKNFFSYDCGMAKVKFLSVLGGKVNDTITWEEQNTALRDMGEVLKQKLSDIKAENSMAKGLHTLEGRMSCQHTSSGYTSSSWHLGFNGQMWLLFDSDNQMWTEVHPGSDWMKEMWENDREMTEYLHWSSKDDCRAWLEKFLEQLKADLEPTGPSSTSPDRVFQKSTANILSSLTLLLILTCFFLLGLRCYQDASGSVIQLSNSCD